MMLAQRVPNRACRFYFFHSAPVHPHSVVLSASHCFSSLVSSWMSSFLFFFFSLFFFKHRPCFFSCFFRMCSSLSHYYASSCPSSFSTFPLRPHCTIIRAGTSAVTCARSHAEYMGVRVCFCFGFAFLCFWWLLFKHVEV